jgi:acyl-[acyl-carrier-protein]-phospholipid O-acyltransferase/long-chain-fatty-acid--[acyl-carrier-protein] ligase
MTQFLGAMNDNFFKFVLVYFLINIKGAAFASAILAAAGAVFVIPFLLFSSAAGVWADKISKRNIIIGTKIAELIFVLLSLLAVYFKSEFALYALLFGMAAQSAVFGPSKYGIIPEIVETKDVSKANGLLSSFTYLAIIIGTFLASSVTDLTNKNFLLTDFGCVLIAIVGLFMSFNITRTLPKESEKKANILFIYEIYQTLAMTAKKPHLLINIFGSAFFLFLGGFAQLNAIPYAMRELNLSEVGGGYLFLLTAVGIAIGSIMAGRISKEKVETGLSCIGGFFLGIMFILLYIFAHNLIAALIILVLLGICGGLFLIPFDSYIQLKSPDHTRGQVIAASNFLSFVGVLAASFCLYLLDDKLGFSPATGFAIMGSITLVFTVVISGFMSDLFLPFFVKRILSKIFKTRVDVIPDTASILIFEKGSWTRVLLLYAFLPDLKIFVIGKFLRNFPFFNGFINTIILVMKNKKNKFSEKIRDLKKRDAYACVFSKHKINVDELKNSFLSKQPQFSFVKVEKHFERKRFLGIPYKSKWLVYSFNKETL